MKLFYIVCTISLLGISACTNKHTAASNVTDSIKAPAKPAITTNKTIVADTTNAPIHLNNIGLHAFSDSVKKDTFKIELTGKTLLDGKVVFQIIDFKGRKIHREDFLGQDLLGDLVNAGLSVKQEEDTIRMRMAYYFKEGNFTKPAIDSTETFDEAYSDPSKLDEKEWNAIKADRKAIGFYYTYGYEGTYGITYSKRTRKAFLYFYSD